MTDRQKDPQDNNDADAAPKARVRRGQRLPQATFAEVRVLVDALHSLQGAASKKLIAGQADGTVGGGTFERKWSAMGFFGFREKAGEGKFSLSERGLAFASGDEDAQRQAMQHALMASGFRKVIDRFSTSPVNESIIAGVLHDDLDVPEEKTAKLAKLLVNLAADAGLIENGRFQVAPIEQAMEAVSEITVTSAKTDTPAKPKPKRAKSPQQPTPAAALTQQQPTKTMPPAITTRIGDGGQTGPFEVSVEVKIDAKNHSPEEIGNIVREIRQALTATAV
jgi:hypothetical protein